MAQKPTSSMSPEEGEAMAAEITPELRDEMASKLVNRFALWSGVAGLIPVPIIDVFAVGPAGQRLLRNDGHGTFVDVTAWNQQAEVITEYCQKGRPVVVEGRLEQDRWETPTGEKRSRLKVVAQRVTFLPGNGGTAPEAEPLPDWATEVLSDEPGH